MDTNTILEVLTQPTIPAWVALLVVMTPILVAAWYIGSHREEKPRHKRRRPAVEQTGAGKQGNQ